MHRIIFRRQARREFDQAGDWYERERSGLEWGGRGNWIDKWNKKGFESRVNARY